MSKIKNGGLDQYGAEHFEQQQLGPAGVEGVEGFYRIVVSYAYRSPSTSSPSSVSTIDAKALRQISADAGSPAPSIEVDAEQPVDRDETGSPRPKIHATPATNDVDRKAFVRQRWLDAINRVRDQISQVSR